MRLETDFPYTTDGFPRLPMVIPCIEYLGLWQIIRDFRQSENLEIIERFWSFCLAIDPVTVNRNMLTFCVWKLNKTADLPLYYGWSLIFYSAGRMILMSFDSAHRAILASSFYNFHVTFRADIASV